MLLGVAPQAIRGGCTPGNSRLGAVSCAHACTNRWRTCAAGVISQANMPHGSAGQFAPLGPGPQWGPSRTDRAGRRDARFARAHRAVSARPRPSAWALNSRPWQLAVARAHQETSARPRGVAPRAIRAHGSSLSLVLIKRLAHVHGGVPPLSSRAHGSSLSLVLINRLAHVRGPVPGLSSRAHGSSLSLVLINRLAHVRGPVPGLSIRAHGSSLSLVLIKRLAHVRGG